MFRLENLLKGWKLVVSFPSYFMSISTYINLGTFFLRLEITVSFGKFCILVSSIYIRPIDLTLLENG